MTPRRASRFTSLSFVPRYRRASVADLTGSRRFLESPLCAFAVFYDSVPFFALSLEGRPWGGELLLAGGPPPVPHSVLGRGLAAFAARRCCPRGWVIRRHESSPTFEAQSHGLRTRCLRFARSLPS